MIQPKSRYFVITLLVMLIGLAARRFSMSGGFIHDYLGDALWAAMIYCGVRFLVTQMCKQNTVIVALSFCFFIELTQLYQAEWLNRLRHTTLGGLVLGSGFLWSDIAMYSLGVGIAYFLDDFVEKTT
jgi:Protein of unknown function (DUF2809)